MEVLPLEVVVEVPVEEPDLGGYLMPLELHEPLDGASIMTKSPSMTEPLRLKYHSISFRLLPSQLRAGVTPDALLRALVSDERVWVVLDEGVMPASASHSYVGSVLKSFATVWKKATASAPLALPEGKHEGSNVL